MAIKYIDPLKELGSLLLSVEKPARYTGGEYGRLCSLTPRQDEKTLKTLIAFPDLYEVAMSNQALKIIYNRLNRMDGISCDRAFAPAPDFEKLLLERKLPLYGLDTGISLKDLDLLMFTLGYELGMSGFFSMLNVSGIAFRSSDRKDDDPIIIMGGPCVSNPLPYSAFVDAFWIGEAEAGFFELAAELAAIKKSGGKKEALLNRLLEHPSIWAKGKGKAVRAIDNNFSQAASANPSCPAIFPVPSMKVVHQHGAVEIMRGCPNGCRFCHAGFWYRPMRQKNADIIEAEAEAFIRKGGYREITLSSLSSGDYQYLDSLIDSLNNKFQGQRISFQLPSLNVSSFSLNLLDKISSVRKSGLTFAIETPLDFWQMALNKQVSGENLVSILREAKRRGWRVAKFYFMIGLPLETCQMSDGQSGEFKTEEEEIVAFVERASRESGMKFNINVGTFVPKAHTPFQWASQLNREEAEQKLYYIKDRLKPQGHKVGLQDPMLSVIEGITSRGDESAGLILEEAYRRGSRLDAWSEFLKRDVWEGVLAENKNLVTEVFTKKDSGTSLPWAAINSKVSELYLRKEAEKREFTSTCIKNCNFPCGSCSKAELVQNNILGKAISPVEIPKNYSDLPEIRKDPVTFRIIFSFSKRGNAVFHPHLGLLEIFSMAFIRAKIPIRYTQGFNPLPRLEIASPLSLGIIAGAEIASIDTDFYFDAALFQNTLNDSLPEGFSITQAMNICIPSGVKKHSLSSLLWGYVYTGKDGKKELVPAKEEKPYRQSRFGPEGNVYGLERLEVLARSLIAPETGESYFKVYKQLYD